MRALRDMNKPKFVFVDQPLFIGLIKDLFPSLEVEGRQGIGDLKDYIIKFFEDFNYTQVED